MMAHHVNNNGVQGFLIKYQINDALNEKLENLPRTTGIAEITRIAR